MNVLCALCIYEERNAVRRDVFWSVRRQTNEPRLRGLPGTLTAWCCIINCVTRTTKPIFTHLNFLSAPFCHEKKMQLNSSLNLHEECSVWLLNRWWKWCVAHEREGSKTNCASTSWKPSYLRATSLDHPTTNNVISSSVQLNKHKSGNEKDRSSNTILSVVSKVEIFSIRSNNHAYMTMQRKSSVFAPVIIAHHIEPCIIWFELSPQAWLTSLTWCISLRLL